MNKTFNGEKLYLLDIRTISPYTIYYGTFSSPKSKKFDLRMFTNPIAITGLYKKQYLVYSLNDQIQVFELGTLAEEKIEPKTSPNTFIAKFKDFYASTSKLELIELYKKHCREAKKKVEFEIEKLPSFNKKQNIIYYRGIMGKIDETYRDFLKQIKEV
jgi:hypothetical protein